MSHKPLIQYIYLELDLAFVILIHISDTPHHSAMYHQKYGKLLLSLFCPLSSKKLCTAPHATDQEDDA